MTYNIISVFFIFSLMCMYATEVKNQLGLANWNFNRDEGHIFCLPVYEYLTRTTQYNL